MPGHSVVYADSYTAMQVTCPQGHPFTFHPAVVKRSKPGKIFCPECLNQIKIKEKHDLFLQELTDYGWDFLSGQYETPSSRFIIACKKGHSKEVVYRQRMKYISHGCYECRLEKRHSDFETTVISRLETDGATLASRYINEDTPITVTCKKGHISDVYMRTKKFTCWQCFYDGEARQAEKEIFEFLNSLDTGDVFLRHQEKDWQYEIDVFMPGKKFGIEHHGLYHHSSEMLLKKKIKQPEKYHYNKYQMAENLGITLLQIWGDEWLCKRSIIESIIRTKLGLSERIIARKCVLVKVPKIQLLDFFEENHLQGCEQVNDVHTGFPSTLRLL